MKTWFHKLDLVLMERFYLVIQFGLPRNPQGPAAISLGFIEGIENYLQIFFSNSFILSRYCRGLQPSGPILILLDGRMDGQTREVCILICQCFIVSKKSVAALQAAGSLWVP